MRPEILSNDQILLIQNHKQQLNQVLSEFKALKVPSESLEALAEAIAQLDELFLIVVVGEFNAGKSALVNAFLGERVLAEGVTPTTAKVTLLRYGETAETTAVDEGFAILSYPLDLLRTLNIVDSPGTNAIIREHERLTAEFVPRSDLVLFITSADRPLTESERLFLEKILQWGKKVVMVVNKADILDTPEANAEVRQFVQENSARILGTQPELFLVSARLAQKAGLTEDPDSKTALRKVSGLDELEHYVRDTLDDEARLALKLRNPLGVARHLQVEAQAANQATAEELAADAALVESIEALVSNYEKELAAELDPRLAQVEGVVQRFEARGQAFFDNTFKLSNIFTLAKPEEVRAKFEQEVTADFAGEIDSKVRSLIDWLVDKDLNTWYQVAAALDRRQAASAHPGPETQLTPQTSRRAELMQQVNQTIDLVVKTYDREREAEAITQLVQDSVAQTALFGGGAVGIGVLVATVFATRALDVTGLVAAGTMAILGLFVIPYKRNQAKQDFQQRMQELREMLMKSLRGTFNRETETAVARLRTEVAPYTAYVRGELEKVQAAKTKLTGIQQSLDNLADRLNG